MKSQRYGGKGQDLNWAWKLGSVLIREKLPLLHDATMGDGRLIFCLLPPCADIQAQLRMVDHGLSGFSVFIGLKGSKEELGLEATNYFIYSHQNLDEA